ncbi:MAG: SprT-like domain-containing protein [Verrucomicrobiota bacterium]
MLKEADKIRARFAPNDSVGFKYRNGMLEGTLIRTNPKRAVVRAEEQEYHVPYELLFPSGDAATQREEKVAAVLQTALELMHAHGLKKWHFKFDHGTRRAGCCNYRDKIISISFNLVQSASDEDIRDTVLHEIAHALVGRKHHHDAIWKAKAREIGCSGERCHRLQFSPPRYSVACENSCWTHTAERQNPHLVCRKCGGKLVYSSFA